MYKNKWHSIEKEGLPKIPGEYIALTHRKLLSNGNNNFKMFLKQKEVEIIVNTFNDISCYNYANKNLTNQLGYEKITHWRYK